MKRYFVAVFILSAACSQKKEADLSKLAQQEIMSADTAMSNLATQIGFFQALLNYAEDSMIIPRPGKLPMMTKAEATAAWADRPPIKELTWKPILVKAAKSGDFGYSFGYSIYKGTDTTTHTNYCTIWRKQKDGSWKFVYDAGNDTPKPPGY